MYKKLLMLATTVFFQITYGMDKQEVVSIVAKPIHEFLCKKLNDKSVTISVQDIEYLIQTMKSYDIHPKALRELKDKRTPATWHEQDPKIRCKSFNPVYFGFNLFLGLAFWRGEFFEYNPYFPTIGKEKRLPVGVVDANESQVKMFSFVDKIKQLFGFKR